MIEGVGHIDYPRGSSDYPLSGGKRGLGKEPFIPIEDLPGGENPEDQLIKAEEKALKGGEEEEKLS